MSSNTKLFLLLAVLIVVFAGFALFSATAVHTQFIQFINGGVEIVGHCVSSTCTV